MENFKEYLPQTEDTREIEKLSHDELVKIAYSSGKRGIILPSHIILEDAAHLLYLAHQMFDGNNCYKYMICKDSTLNKAEFHRLAIDYLYTELYRMDEGKYYDILKRDIIDNGELKETVPELIQQCFSAFEGNLYFPCACGLLSIIEGLLAKYSQSANTRLLSLFERIDEKIKQSQDLELILTATNVKGYIELLTKKSDFQNGVEPDMLNRHWLLHGRSKRNIGKADCLRLFIIIALVLEISNKG